MGPTTSKNQKTLNPEIKFIFLESYQCVEEFFKMNDLNF
jgi:hypothetical protein